MALEGMTTLDEDVDGMPSGSDQAPAEVGQGQKALDKLLQIGKGNLLVGAAFVAGIACIYLMGLRGGPSAASAQQDATQQQVDLALARVAASAGRKGLTAKTNEAAINTFYVSDRGIFVDCIARVLTEHENSDVNTLVFFLGPNATEWSKTLGIVPEEFHNRRFILYEQVFKD